MARRGKPLWPIGLTPREVERVADVFSMGPLARRKSDQKYLDCGLFGYYDGDITTVEAAPGAVEAFYDKRGMIRSEWLDAPYYRKGYKRTFHWPNETCVQSAGGLFIVYRATGQVLRRQLQEGHDFEGYAKVERFDLEEWRKAYLWEGELPNGFIILDLGFWTKNGMYEAADEGFREIFRARGSTGIEDSSASKADNLGGASPPAPTNLQKS